MLLQVRPQKVRLTVDLPLGSIALLTELAKSQGCTMTEAIRRALATQRFLLNRQGEGAKVLLLSPEGELKEIAFRR